jgi:hypothetical protein
MVRSLVGLLIFASLLLAPAARAQNGDDLVVKAAYEAYFSGLWARDIAAMDKVWSHDPNVRNIGPRNKSIDVGWEPIKKGFERLFDVFPQLNVKPDDPYVRVNGQKQADRWVLVYLHASRISE